jgi:hypothetical protein
MLGAVGVLPAIAKKALGKENAGFGLGLLPGLAYKDHYKKKQAKKDAAGREVPVAEEEVAKRKGGSVKKMASGGSASKRADGCATKGKTRGKMI